MRANLKLELHEKQIEEKKVGRLDPHKLSTDFFRFVYFLLMLTVLLGALITTQLLIEIVWAETPFFVL